MIGTTVFEKRLFTVGIVSAIILILSCYESKSKSRQQNDECFHSFKHAYGSDSGEFCLHRNKKNDAYEYSIMTFRLSQSDKRDTLALNSEMDATDSNIAWEFIDLNDDGYDDLGFYTESGGANTYAQYWVFDSASMSFYEIGTFPLLTKSPESRGLQSYERGGFGGMEYSKKIYRFERKLNLCFEINQSLHKEKGDTLVFRLREQKFPPCGVDTEIKYIRAIESPSGRILDTSFQEQEG